MSHDAHNPTPSSPPPERLDAYLDRLLPDDERDAFEHELANNPALRAEVDAQRSIDNSLTRLFRRADPISLPDRSNGTVHATSKPSRTLPQPPATRAIQSPGARTAEDDDTPRARLPLAQRPIPPRALLAAAALIALTCAGLYWSGTISPRKWVQPAETFLSPDALYERKVSSGFNPDWVCETDEQFIKTVKDAWGEPLLIRSTDAVKVVGWSYYEPVLSSDTLVLLTKVDGLEVIVVMDHKGHDRSISMASCSKLQHFRRVFGDVVMYEITPFYESRVLPLVERVESP
jgi:hypothetical protein